MPSEYLTEIHRKFINGVCNLFTGVSSINHGFSIEQTCLEGSEAATIPCGLELVHFDILMVEETGHNRIHYCVECKTRRESGSQTASDLKRHLKIFIKKAYKTMDHMESRYGNNYGFIFVSDVPFGMWNDNINFDFLKEALNDIDPLDNTKITKLTSKIQILIFADWFIDIFKEE